MKDYFSKEAVGSALILGLVAVLILVARDNMSSGTFRVPRK